MTTPNESDYDLLTEHFGYPPVALLDDIINTVNVLADRALDSVERVLLSLPPSKLGFKVRKTKDSSSGDGKDDDGSVSAEEAARREIENGAHQLETLLNAAIDKNFDIFELYTMNNILTIDKKTQPFIKLSHYEGLDLTKHPDKPTTGSITALRRRLQASQKLQMALEAERSKNDVLLRKLRRAVEMPTVKEEPVEGGAAADKAPAGHALAFLHDKGTLEQGGTDKPIATTAEFALSQLQSLRMLSSSLTALLPQLTAMGDGLESTEEAGEGTESQASWRRERSEYIESAARKYLERSVGLELGSQGEVRDGEWQGGGPSATKSEVEGLERMSSILGGMAGTGNTDDDGDEVMT
ncbi:hypothetical protein E4U22_000523 [Claviceps purpurea]|uniref:MTW1 Determining metaphase spindle length n=1 Tax=Claviceps purpurea (strain 20.1) TaxID=1111077 RepID=M1WCY0_CLAP2|nr:hypothetical protein E4U22_000523 [Claviceps purpurea]CCE34460.1 uncharacterized protein CPUR_08392 [Claviceps purpurea 20.1]